MDHCYNIPNFEVDGFIPKTNTPASVAMRGFGKVEAEYFMEEIIERVARTLHVDPIKVS